MRETRFGRQAVPLVTQQGGGLDASIAAISPAFVTQAGKCAARVLVRNTSVGVVVFLAIDVESLMTLPEGPSGAVFELPPGMSETFVLAPGQKLFSGAQAPNGIITFASSDVIDLDAGDERRYSP